MLPCPVFVHSLCALSFPLFVAPCHCSFFFFFLLKFVFHSRYNVFYQRDTVSCFSRPLNNPLPKPDFTNWTYVGESLIDYVPVYHWIYRRGRDFFQFFDSVSSRVPVRFDAEIDRRPAIQIIYAEFDSAPQNPAIYVIPQAILSVCQSVQ